MNMKILTLVIAVGMVLAVPGSAFAQSIDPGSSGGGGAAGPGLPEEVSIQDLAGVIKNLINFLLGLVGGITIILIIWGGIRYIFASGDEKATLTAKHMIEYAILGLVIVLLAVFIVNYLGFLLGAGDLAIIKIGKN